MNEIAAETYTEKRNGFFRSDLFVMLCIYFAVLAIHMLLAQSATIFNLTPDEYCVPAIAAYINGYDWSGTVSLGGYYGYFQGLFYAPIFNLTDDTYLRYDLMIGVNSIIISFAPVIAYYLSRRAFHIKKAAAILFSLICGMYPCYMLLTKYTWNETMCDIIPWIFLLLVYKSLNCKSTAAKQALSVVGALTLIAGYATHGRMLALLAGGIILVIIAFLVMKKKVFCFAGFLSGLVIGFVADLLLKAHFQNALWLVGEGGAPTNTIENTVSRIFSADGEIIANFFKTLTGHFFYFISSTWGMGAIAMVMIISCSVMYFRKKYNSSKQPDTNTAEYLSENDAVLTIFVLLTMAATFVVSVAFKCTSPHIDARADTLIYGRYTECFYPLAIFATLLLIYRGRMTLIHMLCSLCSAALINIMTMLFVVPAVTGATRMTSAMIMGIAPLRYGEKMKALPTEESFVKIIITIMSILFVLLFIQFIKHKKTLHYAPVAISLSALLVFSNVYCYVNYNIPQGKNAMNGAKYMSEATAMISGSGLDTVCCYKVTAERYIKGQFLLSEAKVTVAKSMTALCERDERPHFIIADNEDNLNMWIEDVYLVGSINNKMHLYACTEEAIAWAQSQNYPLSDNGSITYSGAEIPGNSRVIRGDQHCECPMNTSVYTNKMTFCKAGEYILSINGDDLNSKDINIDISNSEYAIKSNIIEQTDNAITVGFTIQEQTEGVVITVDNTGAQALIIDNVQIGYAEDTALYQMAPDIIL